MTRGIWRGYKEIKEAGGWASLVFAGSGIYRFCKYRIGFNEGLTTQLRHLRQSFEVAADTLHPQWRQLLGIVGQASPPRYTGHPHQWVIVDSHPAQPLKSTYRHLGVEELDYQFIDKSVIDQDVFGSRDPRLMPQINPDICSTCAERQSDNITLNRCSCFPDLFGCLRLPTAVQVVGTQNGKNNGVVARRVSGLHRTHCSLCGDNSMTNPGLRTRRRNRGIHRSNHQRRRRSRRNDRRIRITPLPDLPRANGYADFLSALWLQR